MQSAARSSPMGFPGGFDKGVSTDTPTSKRARILTSTSSEGTSNDNHDHSHFVTPQSSQNSSKDEFSVERTTNSNSGMSRDDMRSLLIMEAGFDPELERSAASKKRSDYVNWDDFFFGVAVLSSKRSKNPSFPYGACIVDAENRVIGIGYDGLPRDCPDEFFPFATNDDSGKNRDKLAFLHTQVPYICHAEVNAILNKCSADVAGCRMYVERFPCNECAKVIIQSRIKEVVYLEDEDPDKDTYRASRIMLSMAGVKTTQYMPTVPFIDLQFVSALAPATKELETNAETDAIDSISRNSNDASPNTCGCTKRQPMAITSNKERFRDLMIQEAGYDPLTTPSSHRTDCISWDDYFLAMAFLTAKRSKDPNTQVGAVIVHSETKRILALGYNGFPRGCCDDALPWARKGESELHKKYVYVCHAEVNAVLNKGSADVKGATLYVALFPCNECAKVIIQAGIQEVVFMSDQYHDSDACRASRLMFQMAGVRLRKHIPNFQTLKLRLAGRVSEASQSGTNTSDPSGSQDDLTNIMTGGK